MADWPRKEFPFIFTVESIHFSWDLNVSLYLAVRIPLR